MTRPDDVSAEAWEAAEKLVPDYVKRSIVEAIARAIDAAIAKERERCVGIAEDYDGDGMYASQYAQLGDAYVTARDIAEAIRSGK